MKVKDRQRDRILEGMGLTDKISPNPSLLKRGIREKLIARFTHR